MSFEYLMTGASSRWSVIWLVKGKNGKKDRLVEHEFEDDLSGALDLYVRAKATKRKMVTLRSMNVGFPPPPKYRPHTKMVPKITEVTVRTKKGKRKVKQRRTFVEKDVFLMREANNKGLWWCPYCREFRRFIKVDGFRVDGVFVAESGHECPVCGVAHRDHHVRKWNPRAAIMYTAPARRRASPNKRRRK